MLEYARMYHGATELRRLYRGSTLLWEKPEAAAGLAPWGTNWLLYGRADDAVMAYLQPGIYLHSPARWIAYGFTCAESPEKVDFTRIKNVRAYGSFVSDPSWNLLGGIAALPYTHSTHLNESITATKLVVAAAGSSFIDLDCTGIGGNQILLLYADIGAEMTFTQLEFTAYPDADVTDLSEAVWELRNFEYPATTVITCNQTATVPSGASSIAVHTQLSGGASKSCAVFLDTAGDVIGYGDGWQGSEQDTDHLCSYRQSIPAGTASVVIAVGYAPDMTRTMTPQEMVRCVVCFD